MLQEQEGINLKMDLHVFFSIRKKEIALFMIFVRSNAAPFLWEYFKTHQEELKKECIGICYLS